MFDVGFSELLVIGVVALIVIGPERLPAVARTAGVLLGRLQRYVNGVKADINREIQLDELKKLQQQMAEQARSMETTLSSEVKAVEAALQEPQPQAAAPATEVAAVASLQELDAPFVPISGGSIAAAEPGSVQAPQETGVVSVQQLELGLAPREERQGKA